MTNKAFSALKILIVDDSKTSTVLLSQQLMRLGCQRQHIHVAHHVPKALTQLENRAFDILIIDFHLDGAINGFEFASMLYQNSVISHQSSVLMISGDARRETVLTALSGQVKHFITKPVQTDYLKNKINLMLIENDEINRFQKIIPFDGQDKIEAALHAIVRSQSPYCLESYVFDQLVLELHINTSNTYFLTQMIAHSSTRSHPAKVIAQAVVLSHNQQADQAIELLQRFLADNPLSVRVIDTLCEIYQRQGDLVSALHWATKAYELTPSLSARAIRASKLAALTQSSNTIIKIGYTFANRLSFFDGQWSHAVLHYLNDLGAIYLNTAQPQPKKLLLKNLNNIISIIFRKCSESDGKSLTAMVSLFQCHLLIHEEKDQLAHRKLFNSLSNFYRDLSVCSEHLIQEYTHLFQYFGEYKMQSELQAIQSYKNNKPRKMQYEYMPTAQSSGEEQVLRISHHTPNPLQERHSLWPLDQNTIEIESYMTRFPHSVEGRLNYISVAERQSLPTHRAIRYRRELNQLRLPPNWSNWLNSTLSGSNLSAPPNPFGIVN